MDNELTIKAEQLSPQEQFMLRKQIVALRKKGKTIAEVVEILDVTTRHAQSTWRKYSRGGLKAIGLKTMGRPKGVNKNLTAARASCRGCSADGFKNWPLY